MKLKQFTVDAEGTREPIALISKVNPINFIQAEEVNGVTVFKNDSNSFNYNGFNDLSYCNDTVFENKDSTMLQLKSTYKNITAKLRFESGLVGDEVNIDFIKKSNNFSRYENLDCIYYQHASGKLAIYFNSGNTYNSLGVVTGTYDLKIKK